MQLLVILAKRPHFSNIWFAIIAWRRGQVVQYNNETSFYLFTVLIQCLRKSFKNTVCIHTEVFCSIKILQIPENGFQIYTKRSHKLFLYILRNKYGLNVLKVTEAKVPFYRFTGKEPAALRKE